MSSNQIAFNDISVVVQGAIDSINTSKCLSSIRKYLSGAEIILSTWEGSNVDGLDYDTVLFNKDPGTLQMGASEKNNIKRQICSTLAGIKYSDRKYILKIRSDMVLTGNKFLKYFRKYSSFNSKWKFVKNRILASTIASRDPREWESSFCISDWIFFGTKSDMLLLWDIDYPTKEEENWFNIHCRDLKTIYKYPSLICRYNPEQHILVNFAKKFINGSFPEHMFDNNADITSTCLQIIANNFILLSPKQYNFKFLKQTRKGADRWHIFTHKKWLKIYNNLSNGTAKIPLIDLEKLSYIHNFFRAKKRLFKQIRKGLHKYQTLKFLKYKPWETAFVKKYQDIQMSVVVPCHGRLDLLEQTLESLSMQTSQNFEVILADDSESALERDEIKKLANRFLKAHSIPYKYIYTDSCIGQVCNTNQGLKQASGHVLLKI